MAPRERAFEHHSLHLELFLQSGWDCLGSSLVSLGSPGGGQTGPWEAVSQRMSSWPSNSSGCWQWFQRLMEWMVPMVPGVLGRGRCPEALPGAGIEGVPSLKSSNLIKPYWKVVEMKC